MKRTINVAFLSLACIVSSAHAAESTGKLNALKQSFTSIPKAVTRAGTSAKTGLTSAQATLKNFVFEKPLMTAGLVASSVATVFGLMKVRSIRSAAANK